MKHIVLGLFLLFILEIVVLIQVGQAIGAIATISVMLIAMCVGAFLVKLRFRQVMMEIQGTQNFSFKLLWVPLAGFLFIFPGFVSDIIAILVLIPFVQDLLAGFIKNNANIHVQGFGTANQQGFGSQRAQQNQPHTTTDMFGNHTIDASYEDVTEDKNLENNAQAPSANETTPPPSDDMENKNNEEK